MLTHKKIVIKKDTGEKILSRQESQDFKKSIAGVQKLAFAQLTKSRCGEQSIAFIGELYRNIDAVSQRAFTLEPVAKCQPSCAHCCKGRRVEVSEPEVFYIAEHLRKIFSQSGLKQIIERLRLHVENQALRTNHLPQSCTFLVDQMCSIYAFRPAVCRKAHSLSIEACAESLPSIPQHLNIILDAEALIVGTTQAYQAAGLTTKKVELNMALLAALIGNLDETDWYLGK